MKNRHFYKTADFAKICGTTKRTLLYYDEIGLLKPVYIEENGSRYYSAEQSMLFLIISSLKNLGMSLGEIQGYLDERNPQRLHGILLRQKELVARRKADLEFVEKIIDTRLSLIEQGPKEKTGEVLFQYCEEEYFTLSEPIDSNDPERCRTILFSHLKNCRQNRTEIGHPFAAMIHSDYLLNGEFDYYSYYCMKTDLPRQGEASHTKPSGLYAIAYLYGNYKYHHDIYRRMLDAIRQQGYRCTGYSYKEGIVDEVADLDDSRYITKISIGVVPEKS